MRNGRWLHTVMSMLMNHPPRWSFDSAAPRLIWAFSCKHRISNILAVWNGYVGLPRRPQWEKSRVLTTQTPRQRGICPNWPTRYNYTSLDYLPGDRLRIRFGDLKAFLITTFQSLHDFVSYIVILWMCYIRLHIYVVKWLTSKFM